MFEFGRELKRLFESDTPPRDGLTGGDASLLELLDMDLLRGEARASDIAAGRISAKEPHQRRLEAARVWRELARRSGDPAALRNAVLGAEKAVQGFKDVARIKGWAAARCEQAMSAMLGAELFGDDGLNAAAEVALRDAVAAAPTSAAAAVASGQMARLSARAALRGGDYEAARRAAAAFDEPIAALTVHLRHKAVSKGMICDLRCARAEMLIGCAGRLNDVRLHEQAIDELDKLADHLDCAYEPLAWARVQTLRAAARVGAGETAGRIEDIAEGVEILVAALDALTPDHSPLDWARMQQALAIALQSLGEGSETDRAFEHALTCYDRALWATRRQPALMLRSALAQNRAQCLARRAEQGADRGMIDDAVNELRRDLARLSPRRDPVGWAILQVDLAQLYVARLHLLGQDGDRAAAGMALSSAIEVFGEHGLRSLIDQSYRTLDELAAWPSEPSDRAIS
jgi:tetratricopeptide (TPR) repeat protein